MYHGTTNQSLAGQCIGRYDAPSTLPSGNVMQAGDFLIDRAAHQATLRGKPLDLSPDEFSILCYVLEHHKQVVSTRSPLPAAQAGSPEVRGSNFVQTLSSLRSKLNAICRDGHYLRMESWTVYRFDPRG